MLRNSNNVSSCSEIVMSLRVEEKERNKWSEDKIDSFLISMKLDLVCGIYFVMVTVRDVKKTLNEINKQLDVPVEEIKSKWISLRAQFSREMRNVTKTKSGQSTDVLYDSHSLGVLC